MASDHPIVPRKPTVDLGDALLEVIRVRGAKIFGDHVKGKARAVSQTPSQAAKVSAVVWNRLGSWYQEVLEQGVRTTAARSAKEVKKQAQTGYRVVTNLPARLKENVKEVASTYQTLPSREEKTEFLITWILYVASFLGGVAMGLQAPRFDLALAKGVGGKDRIVLHSFPLLAVNLATEWLEQILEETAHIEGLGAADIRRLKGLQRMVGNLAGGVQAGVATREWRRHLPGATPGKPQKNVVVDAQAYRLAEALVLSLQKESKPT